MVDIESFEGEPAYFECIVHGNPMPAVTWYCDGIPINESVFEAITLEDGTCQLIIQETFPEDEGEYQCIATNEYGSASTSCILYVSGM